MLQEYRKEHQEEDIEEKIQELAKEKKIGNQDLQIQELL